MSPEQLTTFIEWLKEKQRFHEQLAPGKQSGTAYGLNHQSRALAFLEVRTELLVELSKEKA